MAQKPLKSSIVSIFGISGVLAQTGITANVIQGVRGNLSFTRPYSPPKYRIRPNVYPKVIKKGGFPFGGEVINESTIAN